MAKKWISKAPRLPRSLPCGASSKSTWGRVLEEARIDGAVCLPEDAHGIDQFDTIEFASLSIRQKLHALGLGWTEECKDALDSGRALPSIALRTGWSECQNQAIAFLESLRPYIEGFGLIDEFARQQAAGWGGRFSELYAGIAQSIEATIGAVESRDCIRLSDQIALDCLPRWDELLDCLSGQALPALEGEADSD